MYIVLPTLPLLRRPSGPSDPTGSGSGGFNPALAWGLTAPCGSGACSGPREREREREREFRNFKCRRRKKGRGDSIKGRARQKRDRAIEIGRNGVELLSWLVNLESLDTFFQSKSLRDVDKVDARGLLGADSDRSSIRNRMLQFL